MKKNLRGFTPIFILIILALGIIAGIGYFAFKNNQVKLPPNIATISPTPKVNQVPTPDLANWKKYTNNSFDFSFEYPNWLIIQENKDTYYLLSIYLSDPKNNQRLLDGDYTGYFEKYFSASIEIASLGTNENIRNSVSKKICIDTTFGSEEKNYLERVDNCTKQIQNSFEAKNNGKIIGYEAFINPFKASYRLLIFKQDKNLFEISVSGAEGSGPTDYSNNLLDQILSTFHFTK